MRVIILLLVLIPLFTNAQENVGLVNRPTSEDIKREKKKLTRILKKESCFKEAETLNYLFVYTLGFKEKPETAALDDFNWTDNLQFLYRKKDKFPVNYAIVYDGERRVIGYVEHGLFPYCLSGNSALAIEFQALIDYKALCRPNLLYQIQLSSSGLYFAGYDGQETKGLMFDEGALRELDFDQFTKCCWDQYFSDEIFRIHFSKP